jgi:hypothetical protein
MRAEAAARMRRQRRMLLRVQVMQRAREAAAAERALELELLRRVRAIPVPHLGHFPRRVSVKGKTGRGVTRLARSPEHLRELALQFKRCRQHSKRVRPSS